ncbi:hypothetical protein JCM3765_006069 [Sporobolomyces pararoseus]
MDPPPPRAATGPFSSCLNLLSPHLSSSEISTKQLSQIDQAVRATHEWCTKLSKLNSPPDSKTVDRFCSFLEVSFLDFEVESSNCFSPSPSTNRDLPPLHGPRPRPQSDGEKVSAIVHVVKELLTGLNERATSEKDGDWWYRIGNAINSGLVTHLEVNDVGKKTPEDLAYRTFICFTIVKPLVRLVVPDPNQLPKSSADDLGGLGRNPKEMAVKYSALDVLGDLLSKNEQNKTILVNLLKPEHLGSILHAGWDHHLSHLTFELAFRLLPTKQAPEKREAFLKKLFSEDVFGKGKDDLAKSLRKKLDRLNVSENWDEGYQWILKKISQMHIRRSQFFEVLSMEYNHQQLLVPRDRGSESEQNQPTPSLKSVLEDPFYEPKLLWFSRHILAASLTVRAESDSEETEERMVIPLDGIEKVYVHDLDALEKGKEDGAEPKDCLKIIFLIDPSYPLTIATKPHLSKPSHIGSILNAISETQAEEFAAAGEAKTKYNELVVMIKRTGEIAKILHETLLDRGKRYPNILKEISDFPTLASRPRPSTAAQIVPAAPKPQPRPEADATTSSTSEMNPPAAALPEDREEQQRRVTFAASPDSTRHDSEHKTSGTDGLESRFAGGQEAVENEKSAGSKEKEKEASQGSQREKRAVMEALLVEEEMNGGEGADADADGFGEGNGDAKARSSEEDVQQKSPKEDAARRPAKVTATVSEESKESSKSGKLREEEGEKKKVRAGKAGLGGDGEISSDLSDAESDHDKMEDSDQELKDTKERKKVEMEKGQDVEKGKENDQELAPRSKSVTSTYSRSSKAAIAVKKKKTQQEQLEVDHEEEEEEVEEKGETETKSTSSSRRRLRTQSPAAPKKVVAATSTNSASKKTPAAPRSKATGKRGRSRKEVEEEVADEESSQGESQDSDLPHPDEISRGINGKGKKVIKSTNKSKSSKPPPSKRQKKSTSTKNSDNDNGNENGEEEEINTDYDMPVRSLEPKKIVRHQAKKYGTGKRSPAKSNGTKKKAGKGKESGAQKKEKATKQKEDGEGDEEDVRDQTEETTVASKTRPTRAAARKSKPVVEEESEQEEEEETEESASRAEKPTKSGGAKLGGREKKVVPSKPLLTSKTAPEPEKQKAKGRRALESTPPPLDIATSTKTAIIKPTRAAPSASETASNQPRKSFSELIEGPQEVTREAVEPSEAANEEELGEFDAGDFFQENEEEEQQDSQRLSPSRAHSQADQVDPLLSPVADPAKIDTSYVDHEFSQHEQQVDNAQGPQVLVADTPEPSAQQHQPLAQAETGPVIQFGNHRITSDRRDFDGEAGEDVEMEDGDSYEEHGYIRDDEAHYEDENGGVVGGIEDKGFRVADDSGVHFAPSPARRAGGGDDRFDRGASSARSLSFMAPS